MFECALLQYRLPAHRLLHHGLIGDGRLHGAVLSSKGWRIIPRNRDRGILALARRPALAVTRMTGVLAIRLITLLIWIVLILGAIAPTTSTTTAATFLARALRRLVAGLALLHRGKRRILARRALLLLRLVAAILRRLALALFLIAVAPLIAPGSIRILARATTRLISLVAIATAFGPAVPVIAARGIAIALRLTRPGLDRFRSRFRLARKPTEYFLEYRRFGFFARRCGWSGLSRGNALHGRLRPLRFRFLHRG